MVSISEDGANGEFQKEFYSTRLPQVRGDALVARFQDYAEDEGVFMELFDTLRRGMKAKKSVRLAVMTEEGVPIPGKYVHEEVEDNMVQIVAANSLAKILRILPATSSQVTVNANTQTINVSAEQRVAELESVGVSKTEIKEAALAVVDYVQTSKPDAHS